MSAAQKKVQSVYGLNEDGDRWFPPNHFRMLKHMCEEDHMRFTQYMFRTLMAQRLIINGHHHLIASVLKDVEEGKKRRVIINIPPGYTKTLEVVHMWVSRMMAKYPRSRFMHLSYSDELALYNSSEVKAIINSEEFQEIWPMKLRDDARANGRWFTDQNGGMYSRSAGGQVTGFRAGLMDKDTDDFTGALIIDDPVKPDDARSQIKRLNINDRFNNTILSRLAVEKVTPLIVIMQRLHDNDLSGYLLKGGSGDEWHHLMLPVHIDPEEEYPKEFTHGIPIPHDLPAGPLWPFKHDEAAIEQLKNAHPYTYWSQYAQRPKPVGDQIFEEEWWKYWDAEGYLNKTFPMSFDWMAIYSDTAQKIKEHHDFSVFQLWGAKGSDIYLVDQIRGRWKAPDLKRKAVNFIDKHHNPIATFNRLRYMMVEDKVSGTGLIQELEKKLPVPVLPYEPIGDKLSRAMDGSPFVQAGRVYIPEKAPWLIDYVDEFNKFSSDDSHDHDDQVDPTLMAIQDMLHNVGIIGTW